MKSGSSSSLNEHLNRILSWIIEELKKKAPELYRDVVNDAVTPISERLFTYLIEERIEVFMFLIHQDRYLVSL